MAEATRRMVLSAALGVGMAANKERFAWDFAFPSIDEGTVWILPTSGDVCCWW